jgi:hypothetical protein
MPIDIVRLPGREDVEDGTLAFHFDKPEGFLYEAEQFADWTLIAPPHTDVEGNTRGFSLASAPANRICAVPHAGVRQHLRLPRIHPGGSDRLPFSCFRLRGPNASQFRAVSGSPSTGRATPTRTPVAPTLLPCRPALGPLGGVCAGTGKPMPHRVVHLGCVRHRVQRHGCAFTQGTDLPWNAQTQLSWQGATEAFSH